MNDLELYSLDISSVAIVHFLTFSPDGKFFVTGGEGSDTAFIFNTENPDKKIQLKPQDIEPDARYTFPTSASFSPKTDQVCVGYRDGIVRLWDINEPTLIKTIEMPDTHDIMQNREETYVSFFPDGKQILLGSDRSLFIYNIINDEQTFLRFCYSQIISVCFSKSGIFFCAGFDVRHTSDTHSGKIFVTTTVDIEKTDVLDFKDSLNVLTISPNSNYIGAGGGNGKLLIYNVVSKQETYLYNQKDEITSVAFTPDEECICSCNYSSCLIFWNVKTGERMLRIKEVDAPNFYDNYSCAFSLDAKYLILGGFNKITINVNPMAYWDPIGYEKLVENNHTSSVQKNIMAFFLSGGAFDPKLPMMVNRFIFEHLKYYKLLTNNPRFTIDL